MRDTVAAHLQWMADHATTLEAGEVPSNWSNYLTRYNEVFPESPAEGCSVHDNIDPLAPAATAPPDNEQVRVHSYPSLRHAPCVPVGNQIFVWMGWCSCWRRFPTPWPHCNCRRQRMNAMPLSSLPSMTSRIGAQRFLRLSTTPRLRRTSRARMSGETCGRRVSHPPTVPRGAVAPPASARTMYKFLTLTRRLLDRVRSAFAAWAGCCSWGTCGGGARDRQESAAIAMAKQLLTLLLVGVVLV